MYLDNDRLLALANALEKVANGTTTHRGRPMKLIDQNDRTFTHGDLIPVGEMRDYVREGYFKDYDGHGYPVKVTGEVGHVDSTRRWVPSFGFLLVPKDTTHILWFNK